MRRALLVGNPAAGLRPRPGLLDALAERLSRARVGTEIHLTTGPGDAETVARQAARSGGVDTVIAVGGDGTVHEVANGLAESPVSLGVVPAGTMNLLARELGLPLDPLRCVDRLPACAPLPFTMGRAGARRFLLVAGIGFDAFVLDRALRASLGSKVTIPAYWRAGVRGAFAYSFPRLKFVADGEPLEGSAGFIGNTRLYGGGLRITPCADPLDDLLDLCVLRGCNPVSYMQVLAWVLLGGRHVARGSLVHYRRVRRIEIHPPAGRTVLAQMDGEPAGEAPPLIVSCPGSLKVLVPAGWARGGASLPGREAETMF